MKKLLTGLGALLALGAMLIGIPLLLLSMAGNPFSTAEQWNAILTFTPDYGNVILLTKIIPLLIWICWAAFAIPFLVELIAALGGRTTTKRVTAFRLQQRLYATLIGAVAVMFAGGAGALAAPAPAGASEIVVASTTQSPPSAPVSGSVSYQAAQPAQAPEKAPEQQELTHIVVEGDTLWDLADEYLGDGTRYPEIFEANTVVTDPDLILPGWELKVPGVFVAAPAPEAPAVPAPAPDPIDSAQPSAGMPTADTADGGDAGGAGSGSAGAVETQHDATETPATTNVAPSAGDIADADDGYDLSIPLMTAGGVSGVLAAGLLVAISSRRLQQRRRRAKGERIALPEPEVADLEFEMRVVENPIGVAEVDNALRTLQAWAEDHGERLPELLAVRVADDEVALYLTEPAQLPEPFESMHEDGTAWVVRPGKATAPSRPTVSPYPALATIGSDDQGGYLLLDLEQIGALNVVGDEETARGVLNALACEFATNPWSDQIQVTLVGLDDALARDIDRFRVHQVADVPALVRNLRADLEDRREALDSWEVGGVLEARSRATELETWAPHIVIMGETPEGSLREELAELVARMPRLGIATITQGESLGIGATVDVKSAHEAEYRSGGALPPLPFRPQILGGAELELVRSLFATTTRDAHPADLAQEHPVLDVVDGPLVGATEEAETADVLVDATVGQADQVPSADDVTAEAAAEPTNQDSPAATSDESEVGAVEVPDWPAPYIRVLGPVDALNIADADALPGRGIELLAFLLLQDTPSVPGALVQSSLWKDTYSPTNNNARTLAKQVRTALGHDPEGRNLLPEGRSNGGFTTHPKMRTDWHDFCDLIGPDLSQTSTEDLIAAIRLVRGIPFDGIGHRRGWWAWRAPLEETMRAAIIDAADELTHRALSIGKLNDARLGARIAQVADPLNEAGWRLEIETAISTGNVDAFNAVVDAMYEVIGADTDIDEATQQLIEDAHATLPGMASR